MGNVCGGIIGAIAVAPEDGRTYMEGLRPFPYFETRLYPSKRVIFDSLGMSADEAYRMFSTFLDIDTDWSGTLDLEEFCRYFAIPNTRFLRRLFTVLDEDSSGELDVMEFVLGLYNMCTMDEDHLVSYVFDIFDVSGSGALSIAQLDAMLRLLYDVRSLKGNPELTGYLQQADLNHDGVVDRKELGELFRKAPGMISPIMRIQTKLRAKTLGIPWWRQAQRARAARFPGADIKTILRAHADMRAKDEDAAMRLQMRMADEFREEARKEAERTWRGTLQERFKAMGPVQQDFEYKLLVAKSLTEEAMEAKRVVLARHFGKEVPPEVLLADEPLNRVLRRREQLLIQLLDLSSASAEEVLMREREEGSELDRDEVLRRAQVFPEVASNLESDIKDRMVRYREYVRHGGNGFTAIAEESFLATKGKGVAAAARHAAITELAKEYQAERMRELEAARRASVEKSVAAIRRSLENLFVDIGIDDTYVRGQSDWWTRKWDATIDSFTWTSRRTGLVAFWPPMPEEEFEDIAAPKFEARAHAIAMQQSVRGSGVLGGGAKEEEKEEEEEEEEGEGKEDSGWEGGGGE